jgi:hypothetical protein
MNAELVLGGRVIDMAARDRRRMLVVGIYAAFVVGLAGCWFVDRWQTTGVYFIFATLMVNRFLLGGYAFGGLIKPFNGKRPERIDRAPRFVLLVLRVYQMPPGDEHFKSDERELEQRNVAVYKAYGAVLLVMVFVWLGTNLNLHLPRLMEWLHVPVANLLYGLVTAAVVLGLTLPQAILLWTEPDMEEPQ